MIEDKYETSHQVPMLYIEERVEGKQGESILMYGEIYIPETIHKKIQSSLENIGEKGITVEIITKHGEYKGQIRYKVVYLESIICRPNLKERQENTEYTYIDVSTYVYGILKKYLSNVGVEKEEELTEILALEYDIQHMQNKYNCRKTKITLEADIEIQGVLFEKGSIIQGQDTKPKKFCQCLI